jgi:hypothetical protein
MKELPHQHLRLCILAFDPAHIKTPYLPAMYIGHDAKLASTLP